MLWSLPVKRAGGLLISFSCEGIKGGYQARSLNKVFCSFLPEQKMDKNKDGVVTIDEFIESCQKVSNGSKETIPFAF